MTFNTLPVCVLQWKHESLKYFFSVDMAEVDLSDAEKIFIKHGVQVMFILLFFQPDFTNFFLKTCVQIPSEATFVCYI